MDKKPSYSLKNFKKLVKLLQPTCCLLLLFLLWGMSCLEHLNYLREKSRLQKSSVAPFDILEEREIFFDVVALLVGLDSSCFHYGRGHFVVQDVAVSHLCFGTFLSLCKPFLQAGNAFKRIEKKCLAIMSDRKPHHHVVQAFCSFCFDHIHSFSQHCVSLAEEVDFCSLFALNHRLRSQMKFLVHLDELLEHINDETALMKSVEMSFASHKHFDKEQKYENMLNACLAPYVRATDELIEKGEWNDDVEYFLRFQVNSEQELLTISVAKYVPEAFEEESLLKKIISIAQSVFILKKLDHFEEIQSQNSVSNVSELKNKIELLYETKGTKLVKEILLAKMNGVAMAKRMRNFEELDEYDHRQWPLNVLICNDKNIQEYRNVQSFLNGLKNCKKTLAHLRQQDSKHNNVFFLKFRQKSLFVITSILSAITLKLQEESWDVFEEQWMQCRDVLQLYETHNTYVQRISDICFQSEFALPLRNCVQGMIDCCLEFCKGENTEKDFEDHLLLFQTILKGILQSRKILYLQVLIETLSDKKT